MMIASKWRALAASSAFLVVACSGSEDSASDASEFAEKYCEYVASCCGESGLPTDGAQCRQLFAFGATGYDADAGEKCLAAVREKAAASAAWCTESVADDGAEDPCEGVFESDDSGSAPPGASCESDSDCAAGGPNDYVTCTFGSEPSVCRTLTPGTAGAACVANESSLGGGTSVRYVSEDEPNTGVMCRERDGLECNRTTKTCTALVEVDADCSDATCVPTAFCDFGSSTCKPLVAAGGSCAQGEECVSTAACENATRTCTPLKGKGEACGSFSECESGNCENDTCQGGASGAGGLALAFLCGSND